MVEAENPERKQGFCVFSPVLLLAAAPPGSGQKELLWPLSGGSKANTTGTAYRPYNHRLFNNTQPRAQQHCQRVIYIFYME